MIPSYQNGFYAPGRGTPKYPELWRGCVGAWNPGLGNSGSVLRDWSSYNKSHGTIVNSNPANDFTTNIGRYWYNGVGGTKRITVSAINLGTTYSASFWTVNPNGTAVIFAQAFDSYVCSFYGGNMYLTDGGFTSSVSVSHGTINSGEVYHWAVVRRNTAVLFYKNGVSLGSGTLSTNNGHNAIDTIGAYSNGSTPYVGLLTDMLLWKRALPQTEIQLLATRPGIAYELAPRKSYMLPFSPSSQFYDVFTPSIFAGSI